MTVAGDPVVDVTAASKVRGSQPVGLTRNPSRSIVSDSARIASGMPLNAAGTGASTVTRPSRGSSFSAAGSTIVPRSIGPTFAGTTISRLASDPPIGGPR